MSTGLTSLAACRDPREQQHASRFDLRQLFALDPLRFKRYTIAQVPPYDMRLKRFPDYLQQFEMESNGKRVTRDGDATIGAHDSPSTGLIEYTRSKRQNGKRT